jgi:hypothetical protein
MSYTFRKAIREEVGLIVGIIGASGSGKTYSAMRLAKGMAGPGGRFAVIDTERGRAKQYADFFDFDHALMDAPFRPDAYAEAIGDAAKAGYKVIVVDSMSHEWAGVGGILEWQEEELDRMAGDDWKKREACKMASWIKPKMSHKHMIQRLLQVNAHLILCFRAEEKVKMEKDSQGKMQIIPVGWQPICSKEVPYELTVSMLLTPENPGIPTFLKLQEQHKALFPAGKLIDESEGKLVSEWAKGGAKPATVATLDASAKILADFKLRVEQCTTSAGLTALGSQMTDAIKVQMNKADLDALKELWRGKATTLKAAEAEPTPPADPERPAQPSGPPSAEEVLRHTIEDRFAELGISEADQADCLSEFQPGATLTDLSAEELKQFLGTMCERGS